MSEVISFHSNKRFFDDEHFPYGFDRSGEFTSSQAQLLTSHGRAYKALAIGAQNPVTQEEEAFVEFCRGLKEAESLHEKTWKKYMETCNRVLEYHSIALNRASDFTEEGIVEAD